MKNGVNLSTTPAGVANIAHLTERPSIATPAFGGRISPEHRAVAEWADRCKRPLLLHDAAQQPAKSYSQCPTRHCPCTMRIDGSCPSEIATGQPLPFAQYFLLMISP